MARRIDFSISNILSVKKRHILVDTTIRHTKFLHGSWSTPNCVTTGTQTAMAVSAVLVNPETFVPQSTRPRNITETTRIAEVEAVA